MYAVEGTTHEAKKNHPRGFVFVGLQRNYNRADVHLCGWSDSGRGHSHSEVNAAVNKTIWWRGRSYTNAERHASSDPGADAGAYAHADADACFHSHTYVVWSGNGEYVSGDRDGRIRTNTYHQLLREWRHAMRHFRRGVVEWGRIVSLGDVRDAGTHRLADHSDDLQLWDDHGAGLLHCDGELDWGK